MISPATDEELHGWLCWAEENGTSFLKTTAEAALIADLKQMRCYPVGTRINHVANDDEECSRPVELAETQNRLFS